jgi:hypothetical protein
MRRRHQRGSSEARPWVDVANRDRAAPESPYEPPVASSMSGSRPDSRQFWQAPSGSCPSGSRSSTLKPAVRSASAACRSVPRSVFTPRSRSSVNRTYPCAGSVLPDADACCFAFCVTGALQSALQLDGDACPPPAVGVRPLRRSAGPRVVSEERRCRSRRARHMKQFRQTAGSATRPPTGYRTSAD